MSGESIQNSDNLSDYVKKLIDAMEYDVSYFALSLMKMVNIKPRASFNDNSG